MRVKPCGPIVRDRQLLARYPSIIIYYTIYYRYNTHDTHTLHGPCAAIRTILSDNSVHHLPVSCVACDRENREKKNREKKSPRICRQFYAAVTHRRRPKMMMVFFVKPLKSTKRKYTVLSIQPWDAMLLTRAFFERDSPDRIAERRSMYWPMAWQT